VSGIKILQYVEEFTGKFFNAMKNLPKPAGGEMTRQRLGAPAFCRHAVPSKPNAVFAGMGNRKWE